MAEKRTKESTIAKTIKIIQTKGQWFKHGNDDKIVVDWRGSNFDLIARILPREVMNEQLFFRSKVTVHPGEAVLVLEKGDIVDILTHGQVISSGFIDRLKKAAGLAKDTVMLAVDTAEHVLRVTAGMKKAQLVYSDSEFAQKMIKTIETAKVDTSQIDLSSLHEEDKEKKQQLNVIYGLKDSEEKNITPLLTKDRESILLDVKLIINIEPDNAAEIFKLVNRNREKCLSKEHLEGLIDQELTIRVFAPRILQYTADELRINVGILQEMQANAQEELFAWLKKYGIHLSRLSINPALTDYERSAVKEREIEALKALAKASHNNRKEEAEREYELNILKEKHHASIEVAKQQGKEDVEKILRNFCLAEEEKNLTIAEIKNRIDEIKVAAQAKKEELEFLGVKRKKELDWDIDQQKILLEEQIRTNEIWVKTDAEINTLKAKSEIYLKHKEFQMKEMDKKKEIEAQGQKHIENIISIAATSGALNGEVLSETIRQASIRKALDQSENVAQSFANAESQKHSKDNFKEGLHESPAIGFSGQGNHQIIAGRTLGLGYNNNITKMICPNCKKIIPADAIVCGYCEHRLI